MDALIVIDVRKMEDEVGPHNTKPFHIEVLTQNTYIKSPLVSQLNYPYISQPLSL